MAEVLNNVLLDGSSILGDSMTDENVPEAREKTTQYSAKAILRYGHICAVLQEGKKSGEPCKRHLCLEEFYR